MSDDKLRELGRELPWDRPDADRREAVRASLLLAADDLPPPRRHRGLALAGAGFLAGALAAAAIALLLIRPDHPAPTLQAQITASPAAQVEHEIIGSDEVVRVHTGTVRVAAPKDHIRLETRDASVEALGAGDYEAVVADEQLASVTVHTGTARVAVAGHEHPVFLSAGETWHAKVITADVSPSSGHDVSTSPPGTDTSSGHDVSTNDNPSGHDMSTSPSGDGTLSGHNTVASHATTSPSGTETSSGHSGTSSGNHSSSGHDGSTTPSGDHTSSGRIAATIPSGDHTSSGRIAATIPSGDHTSSGHDGSTTPSGSGTSSAGIASTTLSGSGTASGHSATTSASRSNTASGHEVSTSPSGTDTASGHSASGTDTSSGRSAVTAPSGSAFANTDRPPAAATPRTATQVEKHFQAGWALLRANKPREAAVELGAAADAGDRDPLAVDARYFQAVALIKAGATHDAERALVAFLDRAPTSLRRGRASVMLARLIAERGDAASARAWFESALHDPDPDVAAAAQAGLDGLRP